MGSVTQSDSQVFPLFPTPVMLVRGLLGVAMLEEINGSLGSDGWARNVHSDGLHHTTVVDPCTNELFNGVQDLALSRVADFGSLLMGEKLDWLITGMWVNVLQNGGQQGTHTHANSFVSGVVYCTDSHPSANLVIHKDTSAKGSFVLMNHNETTQVSPYNALSWKCPDLKAGDMILFPSHMMHAVPRNQGNERVSVAFNAVPTRINSWGYELGFR